MPPPVGWRDARGSAPTGGGVQSAAASARGSALAAGHNPVGAARRGSPLLVPMAIGCGSNPSAGVAGQRVGAGRGVKRASMRARWQAGSQGPAVSSPPDPLGLKELDGLRATSAAPPQPHREMPVPRVTCWGVGGRGLVGLRPRKLPMAIGAEPLPDRGASLLGPLQWLAQAGDEDPNCPRRVSGETNPASGAWASSQRRHAARIAAWREPVPRPEVAHPSRERSRRPMRSSGRRTLPIRELSWLLLASMSPHTTPNTTRYRT